MVLHSANLSTEQKLNTLAQSIYAYIHTHTCTHTHTAVSYTHLTLPTMAVV